MKKSLLIITVVLAVLISSCATAQFSHDESLPEVNTCTIELKDQVTMTLLNGVPVNYGPKGFGKNTIITYFPPGNHKFVLNWYTYQKQGGVTWSTPHNVEFEREFEAGHTYRITCPTILGINFGIQFKDVTKTK